MGSAEGTYNQLEVYSDGKGTMNSKTYYKTKKGVSQRVISLIDSLHSTSETDGATLSNTKMPQIFELPKVLPRFSLITPEMDAAYMDAVNNGDMETAQRIVEMFGDTIDYTVRITIGVKGGGKYYYDHSLTEIEKGELLNRAELSSTVAESKTPISDIKDKRLVSILQINSSKIVGENGESKVVYHQTNGTT